MSLALLILLAALAVICSGLALALLARHDEYKSACTGNCNQGRACTCVEEKRGYPTEEES